MKKVNIDNNLDEFFDHQIIPHRNAEVLSIADLGQQRNARIKREQFEHEATEGLQQLAKLGHIYILK